MKCEEITDVQGDTVYYIGTDGKEHEIEMPPAHVLHGRGDKGEWVEQCVRDFDWDELKNIINHICYD